MTEVRKKLGGHKIDVVDTWETVYQVPVGKSAICSSLLIGDTANTDVQIAHVLAGVGVPTDDEIISDSFSVSADDLVAIVAGICMSSLDSIRVQSNNLTTYFTLYGAEITP